MKKIFILLVMMFFTLPVFSKTLECDVSFDWISKTQLQRDENIAQIQNMILPDSTVIKYPKKAFRAENAAFLKDADYVKNHTEISNGKKEDADKIYCGFLLKNRMLIAYGIQYKKNMKNIYYYDAMGGLRWIDIFSDNYPNFPYTAYQYDSSGNLFAAYYYVSEADQYVYHPNKTFIGRWYKDKFYNKRAKVIMTRSNY